MTTDSGLVMDDQEDARPERPERERKPFRVRRTGGSGKVLFETTNEAEAKKFVIDNFPRKHHEADDHDVYLHAPDGSKSAYTPGADEEWGEYRTPQEREDD